MNDTRKWQAFLALCERLPKLQCRRLCQACCGPLALTRLEMRHLAVGHSQVKFARDACETESGLKLGMVYTLNYPVCPFLKDGACTVYERRPFVCRIWGLTELLHCPHGCQPDRVLTEREVHEFFCEVTALGF
jgi:hypothetical protein